jgi:hypothetical protein
MVSTLSSVYALKGRCMVYNASIVKFSSFKLKYMPFDYYLVNKHNIHHHIYHK